MKRKIVLLFIFALGIVFSIQIYGQISVTSYSIYAFGINTNQNKKLNLELKTFTNRSFDNLLFEFNGFYNFRPKTYHKISIGLGLNVQPSNGDFINAFTMPFDIEIYPLQDFKRLSLIFEICPEYYINSDDFNLRSLWGIRYRFGDK